MREINTVMFEALKRFEGLKLTSYLCPANVYTVGYGHTGPDVKPGMKITLKEAEYLLDKDLDYFELAVSRMISKPMTENQFSAMVSLAYNIGTGSPDPAKRGFYDSAVRKYFEAGKINEAADAFLNHNRARVNGLLKVLPGLDTRRKFERELFLRPDEKIIKINFDDLPELMPVELFPYGDMEKKLFSEVGYVKLPPKPEVKL